MGFFSSFVSTFFPSTKVYLAGSFIQRPQMRLRADALVQRDFVITHRWFDVADDFNPETLPEHARLDIEGVRKADVVLACLELPLYTYRGTWTEVGAAIALKKKVILYCPTTCGDLQNQNSNNVFFHHPDVIVVNTWEEAIEELSA